MPISISPRGEERIRNGHPWIYRSDVVEVDAAGGDTVRVTSARGRPIGYALYSDRSEIAIRLLTRQDEAPTIETWRERIAAAIAYRATLRIDATTYRLVHGEGDRLPSLIVDRYGDYLVVQTLSQGSDRMLPQIVDLLVSIAQPAGILARNDPKVRALEGLEQKVEVLYGTVPESIEVREGRVSYEVDPYRGQKTGLFLDQRENREAAADTRGGLLMRSVTTGASRSRSRRCAIESWRSTSPKRRLRALVRTLRVTN
jgi:23S rRNA (cytosine1962-C5)-methyltransferase